MGVKVTKIGDSAQNRIMVRLDTTKLDMIERELGKRFVAQIGVLGGKASREVMLPGETHKQYKGRIRKIRKDLVKSSGSSSGLSNAEIGLIHEKGWEPKKIPRRSFLEVPLTTKMPALLARIGNELLKGIEASNILLAYKKLGAIGEGIVLQAFATSGFGKWPDNKPSTIRRKGSSRPLIDTAQLRQSISNRVIAK